MQRKINFLQDLALTNKNFSSFITNLPSNAQLVAKFAIVTNVEDPLELGRVKVTYDNENYNYESSNWVYCLSHPGGRLSSDFIGEKCVMIFESGDPNNALIIGFIPTPGKPAIGMPLKIPVLNQETDSPNVQIPECNESNQGSVIALTEYSGINPRICRRNDQGEYSWQNLNSPQVVQTNTIDAETPSQKIGDPLGVYTPGEIFIRKTCSVDEFVPYISDYNNEGVPRYRPLVSAPVFTRATLADCNAENLGSFGMIKDGNNAFPCICSLKEGKYRWIDISSSRNAIKFEEPFATNGNVSEYVRGKTQNCEKTTDLEDPERDKVQRSTDSPLSPVPDVPSQYNLSAYIKTEPFRNILSDLTNSRNADQGAKDRVTTLRTQLYNNAWQIADNNITTIEDILKTRTDDHLEQIIPAMKDMGDIVDSLADAVAESSERYLVEVRLMLSLPVQSIPEYKFLSSRDTLLGLPILKLRMRLFNLVR